MSPFLNRVAESLVVAIERILERVGDPDRGRLDLHLVNSLRLSHERTYSLSLENEALEQEVSSLREQNHVLTERFSRCAAHRCNAEPEFVVCLNHSVDVVSVGDPQHSWTCEEAASVDDPTEFSVDRCTVCGLLRHSEWGTLPQFSFPGERQLRYVEPPCR